VNPQVGRRALGRFQKAGSELAWVAVGQGAAVLGALFGVRLLTGVLPPAPYGELALGLTVATLAQQTILSPLSGASLRFFATALERGEERAFVRALSRLMGQAAAVIVAGLVLLAAALAAGGRAGWAPLAVLAVVFSLLSGACSALDGMQNAARRRRVVAWHDGIAPWLRFLAAVAAVRALGASSAAAMLGYAAATALVLVSQSAFFAVGLRRAKTADARETAAAVAGWESRILGYAWPFMTWGVFTWAQLAADRWALGTFATTHEVGLYAVLYQLGYFPMSLAAGLLSQLVGPVLFARAGDGSDAVRVQSARALTRRLVLAVAGITVLATTLAWVLHEPVFRLLADARYREVSPLLPWMVVSGGLFAAGQTSILSVLSGASTRQLIAPKITTATVGAALAFGGAAWGGLAGVVFAGVASSAFYCAWALALAERARPVGPRG
jgi:O-antigen/teichoic acid export membrane protein